jgi:UDP-N-acetylglucosamine 4,6-dehydratase
MREVDIVIHTAAMKHITICESNPIEAVKTNILGSLNVIKAAITTLPIKVMNISTDKAVSPVNLYGMTKGCSEKMFIHSNVYSACRIPRFSCCRYGNVLGSRGSVIPLFRYQIENDNKVTLTDERMTRFWILLEEVAKFLLKSIIEMKGGEIFVPKMPSASMMKMIRAMVPPKQNIETEIIGIRKGEKLHETLINEEEWNRIIDHGDYYIIHERRTQEKHFEDIRYDSERNTDQLSVKQLKKLIERVEKIN